MSAGPSLYRRHRPRTFDEVVGQAHVVRTLRNAVERGKVHHAYLFVGSRGTGKTSMAKILAACLNCERGGPTIEPCGVCDSCVVDRGRHVARRDRDGRGLEQLGRRHPRAARQGRVRARLGPPQGLHPRRGAHAVLAGLERVPQDARGAAAAHDLRARHDRGEQGPADGRRPLPPLRLPAPDGRGDRRRAAPRRRPGGDRDPRRGARAGRAACDRLVPRRARDARAARHLRRRGHGRDHGRGGARGARRRRRGGAVRRRRRGRGARRARRACWRSRVWRSRAATPASSCASWRRTRASCSRCRCSARCRRSCG